MAQQTISKMETVQTAMSKLFKNLDSIDIKVPDGIKSVYLQMEKEQMKGMYAEGGFAQMRYFGGKEFITAEQYYKETYGKSDNL